MCVCALEGCVAIYTLLHYSMCDVNPCRLKEYGIAIADGSVVFGQLLGMCDHVTFPLGKYNLYSKLLHVPPTDSQTGLLIVCVCVCVCVCMWKF